MAHVDKAIMAEAKVEDSRGLTEKSTSSTGESSGFFTSQEEATRTSSKDASSGAADGTASSSQYMSKRIQGMMESRNEYATAVEAEIEASKIHWSQLQTAYDVELGSAQGNQELFRMLQLQYPRFFRDWNVRWELGEKIAEGAQAEIFTLRCVHPEFAEWNERMVAKVMKPEAGSVEILQKQWPPACSKPLPLQESVFIRVMEALRLYWVEG